jgi:hypothetical protein
MKTRFFAGNYRAVAIALLLLVTIGSASAQALKPGAQAPDFSLKDQFDKDRKLSDYVGHGYLVLIICWDRVGNDYMSNWMTGVRNKYPGGPGRVVSLLYVADMKGVPQFLQDGIKKKYQKTTDGQTNGPILMDWDGAVPKIFGFHDDATNVYLLDEKGVLRSSAFGKGTPEDLQPILRDIGTLSANLPKPANAAK